MNNDYGKKIANALQAVNQLYLDSSQLLRDCDSRIGKGRDPLDGTAAAGDLSKRFDSPSAWMAQGAYRFYDNSETMPGLIEGITLVFIEGKLEEPLLLIGRIKYKVDEGDAPNRDVWDMWYAFLSWEDKDRRTNVVLAPKVPSTDFSKADDRIEWAKLIAIPLYNVKSVDQVAELMQKVREAK